MAFLYLDIQKSSAQDQGRYVGKVHTGFRPSGEPIYKYFYDQKEYEKYLSNKRQDDSSEGESESKVQEANAPKTPGELKEKVQKEHDEGTKFANKNKAPSKSESESKEDDKEKGKPVKKSLVIGSKPKSKIYVRCNDNG